MKKKTGVYLFAYWKINNFSSNSDLDQDLSFTLLPYHNNFHVQLTFHCRVLRWVD